MLKINSISIAAALALAGSLTLVGCSDSANNTVTDATTPVAQTQTKATSSITGNVKLINNPTEKKVIVPDATSQIVAYNLSDNTSYTTTSSKSGAYDLSGLTEGNYQVIASSTSTTMRSARQVTVVRGVRTVVDIVLQATGIIKGKLDNYFYDYGYNGLVTIPGTSYISSIDDEGNFELINVPAGEVTIVANGYYIQNVTVEGGKTTVVDANNMRTYASLPQDATLVLHYDGIQINTNRAYTTEEFSKLVTLKNSNGIGVKTNLEDYGNENTRTSFRLRTDNIVNAGTYTLNIDLDTPFEQEFVVKDKVAVFGDTTINGGVYSKSLGVVFSNPIKDINSSLVTITYLDDNNATQSLKINDIKNDTEEANSYIIDANFETDIVYKVVLDTSIAEDGLFYVHEEGWYDKNGVSIGNTRVDSLSVYDGEENVQIDKRVDFRIYNAEALDLQTLEVTLDSKKLTLANGGLVSNYYNYDGDSYYYGGNTIYITINSELAYTQDYSMKIIANDSYGDQAIDTTTNFSTIEPQIVGVLPYTMNDNYYDFFFDPYDGVLKAYFNVPIDAQSGQITLHDNTNNRDIDVSMLNPNLVYKSARTAAARNDTNSPYSISGYPAELLPNTEYTMSVSGFTAEDGTSIASTTNTFKTPARTMEYHSITNGSLVYAEQLQNRLEFSTFGHLSESEKKSFIDGLTITSFNTDMPTDKSHPVPLALWEDDTYGSTLVLAFTIEAGKSYELEFTGDVAKSLEMDSSKLTFMTISDTAVSNPTDPTIDIINIDLYSDYPDYNLSANTRQTGLVQVNLPYKVDSDYNSDSYQACNDLRYSQDVNDSLIINWISGTDVGINSTSANVGYYNSHSEYDGKGNYLGSYYRCDINYLANINMSNEVNSTITVTVPEDEIVAGYNPVDTNESEVLATTPMYYNLDVYTGEFNLNFSKPVSVNSLKTLIFKTNPNLNININTDGSYYDEDGNYYTKSVMGSFDSSAYSAFGYNLTAALKYFDTQTQSVHDFNLSDEGIQYTTADLTPLKVSDVSVNGNNEIVLSVNRIVDTDTVIGRDDNGTITSRAFTLTNDSNTSDVTAQIDGAYMNTYYGSEQTYNLVLSYTRSDDNGSDYNATTFTLDQVKAIKAEGSTQELDARSVSATVVLPGGTTPQ